MTEITPIWLSNFIILKKIWMKKVVKYRWMLRWEQQPWKFPSQWWGRLRQSDYHGNRKSAWPKFSWLASWNVSASFRKEKCGWQCRVDPQSWSNSWRLRSSETKMKDLIFKWTWRDHRPASLMLRFSNLCDTARPLLSCLELSKGQLTELQKTDWIVSFMKRFTFYLFYFWELLDMASYQWSLLNYHYLSWIIT